MEGQLARPLGTRVHYLFLVCIALVMCSAVVRLYSMQIIHGDEYKIQAENNHLRTTPLFALRGTISDRNGTLLAWNTTGTSTDDIPRRVYTTTPGFSHILGYVSYPKKDQSGVFWQNDYIGKDGLEKQYQDRLLGVRGERVIAINARHQVEARNVIVDPIPGENLKLSIDKDVQAELYRSIESLAKTAPFTAGAGVIMDIHTGEILAITSYPAYDNNIVTNPRTSEEQKQIRQSLTDPRNLFLDRAVTGLFTPGSTVKPFLALAALMEGVITPEKTIYSSGQLVVKNKYGGPDTVFRDWKAHGYTDMRKAIAESCDEYFYQVGGGFKDQPGLGIERIKKYSELFGFATTTGIDLPDEKYGIIPSPAWKQKVFKQDWLVGDTYHTAIGQYGFQITALELVRGVAALANGGYLVTPHIIAGTTTPTIDLNLPQKDLQVVLEGMRQGVVTGTGGALNIPGIEVASKSGTAELGSRKELVNSWISGFFPYSNPKYAFVVIMEKGAHNNLRGSVFAIRETLIWMRDNTEYIK